MKRVLVAIVLALTGAGSALALDLKKAKLPVEYECRETHSGGIRQDVNGKWHSEKFHPDRAPYRWKLERLSDMGDEYLKSVCDRLRQSNYPSTKQAEGFCLTRSGANAAMSRFCSISGESNQKSNAILECVGEMMLDTDRGVMVEGGSVVFFLMGVKEPRATVTKSDCVRLDR